MKLFKLTNQNKTTYNGKTLWGENVNHSLPEKENPQLCSSDVLHAYTNANLAFLLNPIHADITNPLLWEAEGEVVARDFGKVGCFSLTTVKQISHPSWIGSEKERLVRVAFAVLSAEAVLFLYEGRYPGDGKVREAIEVAKVYLCDPSAAAKAARAAAEAARAAGAAAEAARAAGAAPEIDFALLADKAVELVTGKEA